MFGEMFGEGCVGLGRGLGMGIGGVGEVGFRGRNTYAAGCSHSNRICNKEFSGCSHHLLCRCEYNKTCQFLVTLFDQSASSYQELLQSSSPTPQQLALREGTSVPFTVMSLY